MANPIIIDDGGSVRIRQSSGGNFDTVLDGSVPITDPAGDAFNLLRVENHGSDGRNHVWPPVGTGGLSPGETALRVGDTVTITTYSGHIVTMVVATVILPADTVNLDLSSGTAGIVTARSEATTHKRSYDIANADRIQSVTYTRSGGAPRPVFTDDPASPSAFTLAAVLHQ
jgi:hypothetical protein